MAERQSPVTGPKVGPLGLLERETDSSVHTHKRTRVYTNTLHTLTRTPNYIHSSPLVHAHTLSQMKFICEKVAPCLKTNVGNQDFKMTAVFCFVFYWGQKSVYGDFGVEIFKRSMFLTNIQARFS